jgi:hypothetical protein
MHQPRSAANFRSSSSDIARKILSSAGWVMKISGLIESTAAIFAARAGRCSRISNQCLLSRRGHVPGSCGHFPGKGGGGLSLRFNLERNARSALRWGDGPRAVGFSMRMTNS